MNSTDLVFFYKCPKRKMKIKTRRKKEEEEDVKKKEEKKKK